jgi:hypothetical protein
MIHSPICLDQDQSPRGRLIRLFATAAKSARQGPHPRDGRLYRPPWQIALAPRRALELA